MSLDASSAAPGRTSTAGVIAVRRPGCARRQPGLVGAAGAGELSVAQVERRVGQLAGELAGALVEGVPPASGVPGAESALGPQWNRFGRQRPGSHRHDQLAYPSTAVHVQRSRRLAGATRMWLWRCLLMTWWRGWSGCWLMPAA